MGLGLNPVSLSIHCVSLGSHSLSSCLVCWDAGTYSLGLSRLCSILTNHLPEKTSWLNLSPETRAGAADIPAHTDLRRWLL